MSDWRAIIRDSLSIAKIPTNLPSGASTKTCKWGDFIKLKCEPETWCLLTASSPLRADGQKHNKDLTRWLTIHKDPLLIQKHVKGEPLDEAELAVVKNCDELESARFRVNVFPSFKSDCLALVILICRFAVAMMLYPTIRLFSVERFHVSQPAQERSVIVVAWLMLVYETMTNFVV